MILSEDKVHLKIEHFPQKFQVAKIDVLFTGLRNVPHGFRLPRTE